MITPNNTEVTMKETDQLVIKHTTVIGADSYSNDGHHITDTPIAQYMNELGFIDDIDLDRMNKEDNGFLCIDFYVENSDVYITQIYDDTTGLVYWNPDDNFWSDEDELLTSSLLMYLEFDGMGDLGMICK
jgi:hypothetical protein